jgi:hypothetical protein
MHKHLLVAVALIALAGCARYWAKPGGSEEAFATAKARCESQALARYPAAGGMSRPELAAPIPDLCVAARNGMSCMSNGGAGTPFTVPRSGMSEPARTAFGSCMAAAGWQPVANADEGDRITRGLSPRRAGG